MRLCAYKPPADKAPCPAAATDLSPRGFCTAHEAIFFRDASIGYRQREREHGQVAVDAWAIRLSLPIAILRSEAAKLSPRAQPIAFVVSMLVAAIVLFSAPPAFAQQSVVEKHRKAFPTPLGPANTVMLLRLVASEVGGGLLKKTDGSNCQGYSCDIICFADGRAFDVLIDAEGIAQPTWSALAPGDPSRCELQPKNLPPPPCPPTCDDPKPDPLPIPIGELLKPLIAELERTRQELAALRAAVEKLSRDGIRARVVF
jgi:hypothetical protein